MHAAATARTQAQRGAADPPGVRRAGGFLYIASSAFMLTLVVGIFWQNNLFYLIISVVGAILFSAYLLYDIQARPALPAAARGQGRERGRLLSCTQTRACGGQLWGPCKVVCA